MQLQQEQASKQAFLNSLLKQIAVNTGYDLPDMKHDSGAGGRKYRINIAITPPIKPKSFDMALMGDTPFETPHYEQSISPDLSSRINRRLGFEEQGGIDFINQQEQRIENIKKETIQHSLK